MKIGIVDNYDSFTYNLVHYLADVGGGELFVCMNNRIDWNELDKCTHLVLSPGPGLPSDSGELMEVIRKYHAGKNILGVCLGMQAITEFFGGKLTNLEEVQHGVQTRIKVEKSRTNILYKDIPDAIEVGRYHSWVADKSYFPDCLNITATDDAGDIMSFEHNLLPIFAVQYHPESIMTPFGKQILKNWISG